MIFCVWHRNVTVTGERKKSIYHFLDVLLFLLPYSFCQYRQQLVNLDWLCDMTIHPSCNSLSLILLKCVCSHCNNCNIRLFFISELPDQLCCLLSIHIRHLNIHKNQIISSCRHLIDLIHTLYAIRSPVNQQPFILQNGCCDLCIQIIILCK